MKFALATAFAAMTLAGSALADTRVTVTLDALSKTPLHGRVTEISPVYEEKRGDITYTVTVVLTDGDPKMRWGMTAVTTFEK